MSAAQVIDLSAVRDNAKPHVAGQARCISCGREWAAVTQSVQEWLECPNCRRNLGRLINHVEETGKPHWTCGCGNDLFFIQPERIYCPVCGATQEGF